MNSLFSLVHRVGLLPNCPCLFLSE